VSSQISDAAAAMLIASERAVKEHGLKPRARFHHLSVRGADPVWMLTAPIPATATRSAGAGSRGRHRPRRDQRGLRLGRARLAEGRRLGSRAVNVNGGAIALGHPLGATGTRLMTTLLYELERTGGRYGLQTMCEGGGQANVTIIERLS
jgi:acetyl-CoA C-acetyltransferase